MLLAVWSSSVFVFYNFLNIIWQFYVIKPSNYFLGHFLGCEVHRVIPFDVRKQLINDWFSRYMRKEVPADLEGWVSDQKNGLTSVFDKGYCFGKEQVLKAIAEINDGVAAFKANARLSVSVDQPTSWFHCVGETLGIDFTNPLYVVVYVLVGLSGGVAISYVLTSIYTNSEQLVGTEIVMDIDYRKSIAILDGQLNELWHTLGRLDHKLLWAKKKLPFIAERYAELMSSNSDIQSQLSLVAESIKTLPVAL